MMFSGRLDEARKVLHDIRNSSDNPDEELEEIKNALREERGELLESGGSVTDVIKKVFR
jgi:hypothetical protein